MDATPSYPVAVGYREPVSSGPLYTLGEQHCWEPDPLFPFDILAAMSGRRVEKPWGHEVVWAETPQYVGKILVIEPGQRLSLQYHEVKDETILVLSGRLRLHIAENGGELGVVEMGPGESHHVAPGTTHRYEAIERVELAEVSTPELDDVVRLEDDFGRQGTSEP